MAKLLVLAACTSALLQQPARRVSLTPRMGVVQPWVEINQSIEPTRSRGHYHEDGVEAHEGPRNISHWLISTQGFTTPMRGVKLMRLAGCCSRALVQAARTRSFAIVAMH